MPGKSGAVRAGGAFVELFSDDSKLQRGLKAAGTKLKSWGKDVSGIGTKVFEAGAAVKGALSGAAAVFAEVGAELAHMSERTGIGVESLSQLKYAADQTGVELEDLGTAFKKQQKIIGQASIGNKAAIDSLKHIGLTVQDLINLSPEAQFELIASRIASISNPAQRAAAAMEIFGKNGTAILPLLLKGADGINALKQEADALGLTMSKDDAESALTLHNSMKTVWATLKGVAVAIGAALAPTLIELAKNAAVVIGNVINWIKQNRGLVTALSSVATVVMGVGAALVAAGYAMTILGPAISGVATLIGVFGSAFTAVAAVVGAILSPIGLVAAAVVAIGAYFLETSGAIDGALTWLRESFGGLADDFGGVFEAMKNALAAGDITAAAQVLWAFLKLEWTKGVAYINGVWLDAKTFALETWSSVGFSIAETFETAFAAVGQAWAWTVATMQSLWHGFVGNLASIGKKILESMGPVLSYLGYDVGELVDKLGQVDEAESGASNKVEQDYAADKSKRDAARDQTKKNYSDAYADKIAELEQAKKEAKEKGTAEAQDAYDQAKANLADTVDTANNARKRTPEAITDANAAADDAIEVAGKSGKAVGTFSAFSLGGLGGSSGLDKVADNTSTTNDHLTKANDRLKQIEQNTRNAAVFT
ncbi:MAG TPA: phage tail tape measure protein [Planctomycetaceae bacterium]|jgi:hypothetical protein|nr:phage tail tape measure protein [Planctomycetaceae bacterium]